MRSPALSFLDPVKFFELFHCAKDGPAVCEQSELVLNQNIAQNLSVNQSIIF